MRKCSADTRDGRPCNAWALRDSDPPLCSTHAGRTQGSGPPAGNQNALKHGFYASVIKPENLGNVEQMQTLSLLGELLLGRYVLGELTAYLQHGDLSMADKLAVVPLINSTIRTVTYVISNIEEDTTNMWDIVLDALSEDLGMDL